MRILQKHWSYLAVALAATAFACVKGEQSAQRADSTARTLTLAPTESSAAMKDVPAAQPAHPEKKATPPAHKAPAPKPAAPTPLSPAAGTRVGLAASDSISTRSAKAGDAFTATVGQDVKDASGHVVIPAGSKVEGTITAADPAPNPNSSGKIELAVKSVIVRGTSYPVEATVVSKDTVMQGRGVTGADAAKVAGGAAIGAIAGRLLGKNAKGAVVGGATRSRAGAGSARETRGSAVGFSPMGPTTTQPARPPT